jgi:hypothetical protein
MKFGRVVGDTFAATPALGPLFAKCQEHFRRRKIRRKQRALARLSGPEPTPPTPVDHAPPPPAPSPRQTASGWLDERLGWHRPVNIFPVPDTRLRLTIVTDSVGESSLFGGVGTALVLGTLVANRLGAVLRLATRTERPDPAALGRVLSAAGIELDQPFEAVYAPVHGGRDLAVSENDCFLSTSWWTTRGLLSSIRRDRLCYILQEDERMFYPFNDERLRCQQTLAEPGVFVAINTALLHRHLTTGPHAIPGLGPRAVAFEPAFPGNRAEGPAVNRRQAGRRQLFFYARPHHPRNLFVTGLDALVTAISQGIFTARDWQIHLVGRDVPDLEFPAGMQPSRVEGLSWNDYNAFVNRMDAGFVLMDTPHPSYPPLDLAAAGAAVLTNRHGSKIDLSRYSSNILMADTDRASLVAGLARLAERAADDEARAAARAADGICRDWSVALEETVSRMAAHYTHGMVAEPATESPAILPVRELARCG